MDRTTLESNVNVFRPALLLDLIIGERMRRRLRKWGGALAVLALLFAVYEHGTAGEARAQGIFLIIVAFWAILWLVEFLYHSYYFLVFGEGDGYKDDGSQSAMTLECAALWDMARRTDDPVWAFIASPAGSWVLARCGIGKKQCVAFLSGRAHPSAYEAVANRAAAGDIVMPSHTNVRGVPAEQWGVREFLQPLVESDQEFLQFLLEAGIEKDDAVNAAGWFDNYARTVALRSQWWSRRELARIPGLAKDWSYGNTYVLDKYSTTLTDIHQEPFEEVDFEETQVEDIEHVLAGDRRANLLLVGEKDQATVLIDRLVRKIQEGTVFPEIEHKRVVLLDFVTLVAVTKEKGAFEEQLILAMNDAVKAGNIIIVIDNFPNAIADAHSVGSDLSALLDPYLASNAVQIAAVANAGQFHQIIENQEDIMSRFQKVLVKRPEGRSLRHIVEREAFRTEAKTGLFLTFPAIRAIAESSERYFSDASAAEKAEDLFTDLVEHMRERGRKTVTKQDVLDLVRRKTGIPLGEVTKEESAKLLNLEQFLHERVIGQEEAIKAISSALRRARSGINSPDRPIGSFLFMGPTGVGKTETAKALALQFFGAEERMLRLDMTEYKGPDSLERLIGSFDGGSAGSGRAGVLSSMLRDKQYGVLLLDEFEKANEQVHDLFLQILDEGYFSDVSGAKVNARNTIIIATSNAGSAYIWQVVGDAGGVGDHAGQVLEERKQDILDKVIGDGTFKPELINRFDGVIFFHPLTHDELAKVATLMLAKVAARIRAKGIELVTTPELVEYLVNTGSGQKFGGRAMNRAIQEQVEEAIAKKVLSGEAKPGSRITLDPKTF